MIRLTKASCSACGLAVLAGVLVATAARPAQPPAPAGASPAAAPATTTFTNLVDQLLNEAQAAHLRGDTELALSLASQAIRLEPRNPQCYYVRGRILAEKLEHAQAVEDFNMAIKLEPRGAELYQFRGLEQFKLGRLKQALADFDRFLEFVPQRKPFHWERGMALYYLGRFDEAQRQFEQYLQVKTNDVQAALWHFACVARTRGLQAARRELRPLPEEAPPLMRELHRFYAGQATPQQVMALAEDKSVPELERRARLFYARFYLGLYEEAAGRPEQARQYIQAAREMGATHFLGSVARVHWERIREAGQ